MRTLLGNALAGTNQTKMKISLYTTDKEIREYIAETLKANKLPVFETDNPKEIRRKGIGPKIYGYKIKIVESIK